MKLDGYIRVSQVGGRGGESFISPAVQREQISAWAVAHGHEIDLWHEDLDQSGGTIDRPGFQMALGRIEAGLTEGLVVAKLDRFARSVPRAWDAMERIQKAGGTFASVAENIDLSSAGGTLHFNMLGSVAQFYRDSVKERWDESNADAIRRGIHFTARVPFGYVRGEDRRLCPDPLTAPLVVEVFKRRARRESRAQIARWLDQAAPRPGGGALWTSRNVATIIQNRAYLGHAFHGRHRNESAHPALVTPSEFDAANAVRGGAGTTHETGALLAGLIRCAGCRYAMRRTFTTYRSGKRVEVYSCQRRHTGGNCPAPASVVAENVERVVAGRVLAWTGGAAIVPQAQPLEDARRTLAAAEERLSVFASDDELREALGRSAFIAEAETRRRAVEVAAGRLSELASRDAAACARAEATLAGQWADWDHAQRRAWLRMNLETVYVHKGRESAGSRVMLRWANEDQYERPRRGTCAYSVQSIPWDRGDSEEESELVAFIMSIPGWALAADDVPALPELRRSWPSLRNQMHRSTSEAPGQP